MKKYVIVVLLCAVTLFTQTFCMDKFKKTPLMDQFKEVFFCTKNGQLGDFDTERELIRKGLDINQPIDKMGRTLLHHLLIGPHSGHDAHIGFLLEYGADLDVKDNSGTTPFDMALLDQDSKKLSLLSAFGYQFFPKSVDPQENPLELLQNKAELYKEFIKKGDTKATNTLATLFMFIQNNENYQLSRNHKGANPVYSRIVVNQQGCCFKHATFTDLAGMVGKEAVEFVMQDLNMLSEQAFDVLLEQSSDCDLPSFYGDIQYKYPFVRIYRERNPLELLKNGAQLHRQLAEFYGDLFPEEHDFMLAKFLKVIESLRENKETLHYCGEKIESFDDLERIIGKDAMEYVTEDLLPISEELQYVDNFPWNDRELCSYFQNFFRNRVECGQEEDSCSRMSTVD